MSVIKKVGTPLVITTLILAGGVYFGVKKALMRPASINIVEGIGGQGVGMRQERPMVKLKLMSGLKPMRMLGKGEAPSKYPERDEGLVVGQSSYFEIVATNKSGRRITGFEGRLVFDPKIVAIESLQPAKELPVVLKKWKVVDVGGGKKAVEFAYGAPVKESQVGTTSQVAVSLLRVKYKALKQGFSTIGLDKDTVKVTVFGEKGNVFDPSSEVKLVVKVRSVAPKPSPIPWVTIYDINGDGMVNVIDYNLFLRSFGKTGDNRADFDGDKVVDVLDYNMILGAMKLRERVREQYPRIDGGPVKGFEPEMKR